MVVEAIEPDSAGVTYPVCLTGKRACPPEDCGGPWGYSNLLAALSDPTHEEHEEYTEWVGEDFDPEDFDADEATEDMRSVRPLKGGDTRLYRTCLPVGATAARRRLFRALQRRQSASRLRRAATMKG